jgi:hypothetical protein
MRRFPYIELFRMALISLFVLPLNSATTMDQKLLSLVPPGAQVVAGMSATSRRDTPGSFLLVTHSNTVDLQDFFALIGADGSHIVRQIVFVAIADNEGRLNEHSLLASGHFDQSRIYRSATDNGAELATYRGIPILSIKPFARERGDLDDVRSLAVLNSDVLLFGTIASVHQELDRHLTRSSTDPSIVQRLSRLQSKDETWCLVAAPVHSEEIRNVLGSLDPALGTMIDSGDAFQFGIHYAKQVEFEYEIATASTAATRSISDSLTRSLAGPAKGSSLLDGHDLPVEDNTVRGVIKVSMGRYNAWIAEFSSRSR